MATVTTGGTPEKRTNELTLYPLGTRLPVIKKKAAKNQKIPNFSSGNDYGGPKPLNINKYLNKQNKNKSTEISKPRNKGGRQHQLKNLIRLCKKLLELELSIEEREHYEKILKENKTKLNNLKRGKRKNK